MTERVISESPSLVPLTRHSGMENEFLLHETAVRSTGLQFRVFIHLSMIQPLILDCVAFS